LTPDTPSAPDALEAQKRAAADRAVEWVESGMTVGLGTGSTAVWAIRGVAARLRRGTLRDVVGIPTSTISRAAARDLRIPLATLDERPIIDVTIDGADEVDPDLNLIKGGGGALLREKIVAQATRREVIVVDDSKPSARVGTKHALPVEVVRFACTTETAYLASLGAEVARRGAPDGQPYVTDEGNWILDCRFGPIDDVERLGHLLHERAGIVEHGLFVGLTDDLLVAGAGGVDHRFRR
jgi:ribose 5-phosphate isomerase A